MEGSGQSPSVPILGQQAEKAVQKALMKTGIICPACGEPTAYSAPAEDNSAAVSECWEFVLIKTGVDNNGPFLHTEIVRVCMRESCAGARELAEDPSSAARRKVPAYVQMEEVPGG